MYMGIRWHVVYTLECRLHVDILATLFGFGVTIGVGESLRKRLVGIRVFLWVDLLFKLFSAGVGVICVKV